MKDLTFLQYCHNDDLKALIDIITKDKDGNARFNDEIIGTDKYKRCYPNKINEMWWDMANELRLYGGNTFANIFRGGEGVPYKEIVEDVAKKLKVNFNSKQSVETIELGIISTIFEKSMDKMTTKEIEELAKELGVNKLTGGKQALTLLIPHLLKQGGFATYKITMIVANAVTRQILGRGLAWATNAAINQSLARAIGFATGPIMWIITGLWVLVDIAAPAYRVTVPSVIMIACMRQRWIIEENNKKKNIKLTDWLNNSSNTEQASNNEKEDENKYDVEQTKNSGKEIPIENKKGPTSNGKWIYSPKENKILIDGNNLCYDGGGNYIGFKALLPLIKELKSKYKLIVFFDKSIHKLEKEIDIKKYFPEDIETIVSQTENDKVILQYAQGEPLSLILSNDNFKEHEEKSGIEWKRFIKHSIVGGRIIVLDLDINIKYD